MASRGTSCDRRKASLFLRAARKRAIPPPSPLSHKSSYVFTVHTIVAASASFTARSKLSSASDRTSRHGPSLWATQKSEHACFRTGPSNSAGGARSTSERASSRAYVDKGNLEVSAGVWREADRDCGIYSVPSCAFPSYY